MPWNIVTSKLAAGLSNTSDNETIIILNPWAEFITANAEIKWLWELLEARDTPVLGGDELLLDTYRLATVFAALS